MKRVLLCLAFLLVSSAVGLGQEGTAGSGYWPAGYTGNTWTGVVTAVDEDKRELTLTYTGKKKAETFTGTLRELFLADAKPQPRPVSKMSELMGMRITVYYLRKSKKDASGVKHTTFEIFQFKPAQAVR